MLLRGRPVTFDVDVPPDATVVADRQWPQQILVNLLSNAAKFTEVGSVRLLAHREGGRSGSP